MSKVYTDAEIQAIKDEAYKSGGNSAVMWLEEVYGTGIHGTDAYAEFGDDTGDCECEWCDSDEEEEE